MAEAMDATTLETISLLEARLLRIEHVLYGAAASPPPSSERDPATTSLENLERRFAALISRIRPYGELMKLYRTHPTLFQPPQPDEAPTQLPPEAVRATVLAAAASFPAAASSLTAVSDSPVPDPALSASLVAQLPRMRAVAATQLAQAAELAELRARSERLVRAWYERGVLDTSQFVADVEERAGRVERRVRRAERAREADRAL